MEITEIKNYGNGITRYYFYDHTDDFEHYVSLNKDGTYFDGTFKADSTMTKIQIEFIQNQKNTK